MFDFGNANESQRKAIETTDGPVLITAGPGTGKTFTLVQRAIYLIQEKGIRPESILMATFTEKAAKELVTRITNELAARGIVANINEMYIGTFHSLCLRIIKEHLEYTRLKRISAHLTSLIKATPFSRTSTNSVESKGLIPWSPVKEHGNRLGKSVALLITFPKN